MSKLHRRLQKKDLILCIILLILIILNLILYLKEFLIPKQEKEKTYKLSTVVREEKQQIKVPTTEEEIIKQLSTYDERQRMEYYCGTYFNYLEEEKYELAYNLLYPEFKQTYFPTLEEYVTYIEKTYPSVWALEYNNITRQGDIYVLKLNILDVLGSKENEKSQRVVLKENTYNDFVLSFQVI